MDTTKGQDMNPNWLNPDELWEAIRPANFNPADAVVVGVVDLRPPMPPRYEWVAGITNESYAQVMADYAAHRAAWEARNVELFGRPFPGGRCEHCHASIRWAYAVKYIPTGQHFVVGETCGDERMSLVNRNEFDMRLLQMAAIARDKAMTLANSQAEWANAHPAEAAYLASTNDRAYDGFISELADKFRLYGALSDKQTAIITARIERDARRDAQRAEAQVVTPDKPALVAPDGRVDIEGKVISTKVVDNGFGTQYKMLVELADGNRIYGTIPKAIDPERGDTVAFTARIEASRDDRHFGFFSRPSNATIVRDTPIIHDGGPR